MVMEEEGVQGYPPVTYKIRNPELVFSNKPAVSVRTDTHRSCVCLIYHAVTKPHVRLLKQRDFRVDPPPICHICLTATTLLTDLIYSQLTKRF